MTRRSFLSMVSCAALSAVVPKPKYFFLNGLWRTPETGALTPAMLNDAIEDVWRRGGSPYRDCVPHWGIDRGLAAREEFLVRYGCPKLFNPEKPDAPA